MVRSEVLLTRLEKLREYVGYLRKLRQVPRRRFVQDPFVYGNAERYLQLAIECVLDIGSHILSDLGSKHAEEYREILSGLGEAGVLSKRFAKKIEPMAGLRNLLVHDYLAIDRGRIYDALQRDLTDFSKFARAIQKFL